MLTPLSVANRSISASSSGEKPSAFTDATFCSSCSTLLAPITVEVTRGSRSDHAKAICASVWPRSPAISLSARILARVSSFSQARSSDPAWLARDPTELPLGNGR